MNTQSLIVVWKTLRNAAGLAFPISLVSLCPAATPDLQTRIDTWNKDKPGGVAVAWVDEKGVQFLQTGRFAKADDRPVTPDTQFEIGSITKVFTSLLLAESERAGKVSRDDPVTKCLKVPATPEGLARLKKITLLMLATHTSGLPRLPPNLAPGDPRDPYADYTREKLLAALAMSAANVKAPADYAYSNFWRRRARPGSCGGVGPDLRRRPASARAGSARPQADHAWNERHDCARQSGAGT